MKQPIRYFSIGLLTASILLLIIYLVFESDTSPVESTMDEMIVSIEDEGYRVITESEYISLSTANDGQKEDTKKDKDTKDKDKKKSNKNKKDDKKDKKKDKKKSNKNKKDDKKDKKKDKKKSNKKDKKDKKKDKKVTYTLVIEENTMPSTISQQLENNKIIDSATEFSNFLENNDYSPYVQIGEFKVTSDMSLEDIAKEITNK